MLDRPGPPVAIDEMATQAERPETLTGPTTIHHRRGPQPRQVPAAFLLAGRDPHRDELTRPEQTHQPSSVTTIGLDFVARSDRHQRRCDHLTVDTHRPKQPMQLIAGRAGLVTRPQPARPTQPGDQTTNRHLVMSDLLQPRCRLRHAVQHPHRDRVLRDIEAYPLHLSTRHADNGHGRLLSSMWLRRQRDGGRPTHQTGTGAGRSITTVRLLGGDARLLAWFTWVDGYTGERRARPRRIWPRS